VRVNNNQWRKEKFFDLIINFFGANSPFSLIYFFLNKFCSINFVVYTFLNKDVRDVIKVESEKGKTVISEAEKHFCITCSVVLTSP